MRSLALLKSFQNHFRMISKCFWCARLHSISLSNRPQYACRKAANLPVPPCVEDVAVALNRGAAQQMRTEWEGTGDGEKVASPDGVAAGHERLRLAIGRMMGESTDARHVLLANQPPCTTTVGLIAERLQRPDGRLHMYSAHDWTVAPLLLCVARHDDPELSMWAPFCSNISFELWSEVRVCTADRTS